jgi:hypothetical protein
MTKQSVYNVAIIAATSNHICGSPSIETRTLPFASTENMLYIIVDEKTLDMLS